MFEVIMALLNLVLGLYLMAIGKGRALPRTRKPISPEREARFRRLCYWAGIAMLILAVLYLLKLFFVPAA
ncbi:hypothetical protein [Biformimicrobium ophioploci]|uniref:Uncharacterized protein n=1 Tax=Biformimicrobium ophioploci TaxID=3036711 RepID=A0ABQ6LYX9_9GAMM|nr:hypothetical protein [Microbulbifer sp. NKW57]GMG87303.1 hypothetical protein MNKW57_16240 [Microbulbifer sp. NKW57]